MASRIVLPVPPDPDKDTAATWQTDMFKWGNDIKGKLETYSRSVSVGINSTPIGAGDPSTGVFTTLKATGATTLTSLTLSGAMIGTSLTLSTGYNGKIGQVTPAAGAFTTLSASSTLGVTGATTLNSLLVQNSASGTVTAEIKANPASGTNAILLLTPRNLFGTGCVWTSTTDALVLGVNATGVVTINASGSNTPIGQTTPAAGSFTTLTASGVVSGAGFVSVHNNVGRNLLHNGAFRVQQRGTGAFTTTGAYTADRWLLSVVTSTLSVTIATLADADRTAIGDESAQFALQAACTGTAGASDVAAPAIQRIESLRRTSGDTVMVSFWAKATSGTPKLGLDFVQNFGSGGSPSSNVQFGSTSFTLSTTWTRYTYSVAVTSTSGKTFGSTAGSDYLNIRFWQSSGATNNAAAGSIGVQSYTLLMWGVQLENGAVVTPLEKPEPMVELAVCQRFYQVGAYFMGGYGVTTAGLSCPLPLSVPMRSTPTCTEVASGDVNVNTPSITANGTTQVYFSGLVTANGGWQINRTFTASADL